MSFTFADYRIDIGSSALGLLVLALCVAPALISIVAILRIVQRAGFSGWWALIAFIPILNVLALWYLAFAEWPAMPPHRSQPSDPSQTP